jgi:hypothetical protein
LCEWSVVNCCQLCLSYCIPPSLEEGGGGFKHSPHLPPCAPFLPALSGPFNSTSTAAHTYTPTRAKPVHIRRCVLHKRTRTGLSLVSGRLASCGQLCFLLMPPHPSGNLHRPRRPAGFAPLPLPQTCTHTHMPAPCVSTHTCSLLPACPIPAQTLNLHSSSSHADHSQGSNLLQGGVQGEHKTLTTGLDPVRVPRVCCRQCC